MFNVTPAHRRAPGVGVHADVGRRRVGQFNGQDRVMLQTAGQQLAAQQAAEAGEHVVGDRCRGLKAAAILQAQGDLPFVTLDAGAKMAVEKRKVFDEKRAGAVQRSGHIKQVGQAVSGGGHETPAGGQANQRVAGFCQGQGPEAPREHQRHAQKRRAQLEQAAAKHRFDQRQVNTPCLQFFNGGQQGRGIEGVCRWAGQRAHQGFSSSC
ncbi:hypothetical protein D3C72_1046170 [compost metagenome]